MSKHLVALTIDKCICRHRWRWLPLTNASADGPKSGAKAYFTSENRATSKEFYPSGIMDPTKVVYILTIDENRLHEYMLLLSITSLRVFHPDIEIVCVIGKQADELLHKNHSRLFQCVNTWVICNDVTGSATKRSRSIKTSLRSRVSGRFLFLDTDTIIVRELDELLNSTAMMAMAQDQSPGHAFVGFPYWHEPCYQALGWKYPTKKFFNTGVAFVQDCAETHALYEKWESCWKRSGEINVHQDQPAFNHALEESGIEVEELPIRFNAMISADERYRIGANILHFFSSITSVTGTPPRFKSEYQVLIEMLEKGGQVAGKEIIARMFVRRALCMTYSSKHQLSAGNWFGALELMIRRVLIGLRLQFSGQLDDQPEGTSWIALERSFAKNLFRNPLLGLEKSLVGETKKPMSPPRLRFPTNLSPTFLIYSTGFAPTNGHSMQLQRLFGDSGESLVHLMWDTKEAGGKSVRWVVNTDSEIRWKPPFQTLGRVCKRSWALIGRGWWNSNKVNSSRLARALADFPIRPRQAYINFFSEEQAVRAFSLWDAVGRPPFVLHIVDIFDPQLSEKKTPKFLKMVRAASHVLCLNHLIAAEMKRIGAAGTRLFPLCSDIEACPRTAPAYPLKIVITGALYAGTLLPQNHALQLLIKVWPRLAEVFPGAELHYSGIGSGGLPAPLRPWVRDHGLLGNDDYRRLLVSCHIAYVPVAYPENSRLRFSMPSRIPDYLISGLPVIACTAKNNGIAEFFQSTPVEATRLVWTPDEFIAAVQHFAGDAQRWERASQQATDYSRVAFAVEPARRLLFNHLNAAGDGADAKRCKDMSESSSCHAQKDSRSGLPA